MSFSPRLAALRRSVGSLRQFGALAEPFLYLLPSLAFLGLFVFYPTLRSLYLSLFLTDPLGRPSVFVGFENYATALADPSFRQSTWISLLYVLFTVPGGLVISLVLAILASQQLRGIRFFQLVFSSPLCISAAIGSTIFLMMYNPLSGIFNYALSLVGLGPVDWLTDPRWALWSVGLASIWMRLGFTFTLMLGGLQNVPAELYDAARVDGAGTWPLIRHITLPLLSPTIFFAAVVGVIHGLQTFGEVDLLTGGGPVGATNLVVYQIYQEAFQKFQFGSASAQALLLFGVILVFTYLQFRLGERRVHYQ